MARIGIFADVDLNLIDGSSLWVESIAKAITRHSLHHVVVISKRQLKPNRPIPQSLRKAEIAVYPPPVLNATSENILRKDHLGPLHLDLLIVRGLQANLSAVEADLGVGLLAGYVTEFDRSIILDDQTSNALRHVNSRVDWMIVQTEQARDLLSEMQGFSVGKFVVLPPMLDTRFLEKPIENKREHQVLYGGKFAPDWGILELAQFIEQSESGLCAHLFGDKVHDPTGGEYAADLSALRSSPKLFWHGAVEREDVIDRLRTTSFAWAWRTPKLETQTLEISSKLLEACAVGCLPICFPNQQNRALLGDSYPLFVDDPGNVEEIFRAFYNWPAEGVYDLRKSVRKSVAGFCSAEVVPEFLQKLLPREIMAHVEFVNTDAKQKILVAGHDLKFATEIIKRLQLGYEVTTEIWRGHNDPKRAEGSVSADFDLIWCEWALGNAAFYSRYKLPHQKLFIRFHLQEFETEYPEQIDIDAVEQIIFVNDYHRHRAQSVYGWPSEKLVTVANFVDKNSFFQKKPEDAIFNIAMVGIVPSRKRIDRALDVIEKLRMQDERWRLWIKGARPEQYSWMLTRTEELEYYQRCEERAQRSKYLREGVIHVDHSPDVPQFLHNMGWVLSPSDFESFHLAIIEGAAAGCVPVIWNWDAAETIYDDDLIVNNTQCAIERIANTSLESWLEKSNEVREQMTQKFDITKISADFYSLFRDSLQATKHD